VRPLGTEMEQFAKNRNRLPNLFLGDRDWHTARLEDARQLLMLSPVLCER